MAASTLNTESLDYIINALKNPPVARVGVLADQNTRKDDGSNAAIGLFKHEMGEGWSAYAPSRFGCRSRLTLRTF